MQVRAGTGHQPHKYKTAEAPLQDCRPAVRPQMQIPMESVHVAEGREVCKCPDCKGKTLAHRKFKEGFFTIYNSHIHKYTYNYTVIRLIIYHVEMQKTRPQPPCEKTARTDSPKQRGSQAAVKHCVAVASGPDEMALLEPTKRRAIF